MKRRPARASLMDSRAMRRRAWRSSGPSVSPEDAATRAAARYPTTASRSPLTSPEVA